MDIEIQKDYWNRQKELYYQLREVSTRQREVLELGVQGDGPLDRWRELQQERQTLMEAIDRISLSGAQSEDYLAAVSHRTLVEKGSAAAPDYYQHLRRDIALIIQAIQANDRRCKEILSEEMAAARVLLARSRENKKVCQAYTQGDSYGPAWFFDKKR